MFPLVSSRCGVGEYSIEVLFQKFVLHWDPATVSMYGSLSGVAVVVSMLFVPTAVERVIGKRISDIDWVQIGLWAKSLFFLLFGFSSQSWHLFGLLLLLLLCGQIAPRARVYLSVSVSPEHQTEIFVGIAAVEAIGALLSPLLSYAYARTVFYFAGTVYVACSGLDLIAACVTAVGRYQVRTLQKYVRIDDDEDQEIKL